MIGGFIVTGSGTQKLIVRAIGPSLAQKNVPGAMQDPVLALHGPDGSLIVTNDNWKDAQQSAIEESKLAPTDERESAIVATLQPGAYTAIVRGRENTTGAALVEIYDIDAGTDAGLSNISTRGNVRTGDERMIGGFMLETGGGGDVVVRALGRSLAQRGVQNPLQDPTLELRDADGERLVFNDNWNDDPANAAAVTALGLAPTDPNESAIAVALPRGQYTAIVSEDGDTTGVGLVEVYVVR
jgi:hypothetical protein